MVKLWTLERARGAVKAAFFSRSIVTQGEPEDTWLRFTEIRNAITATEGRIGDRTLSRVLKILVDSGELRRRLDGHTPRYGLVIRRSDVVRAFARAEGAAIEAAGTIGGWGDGTQGWAVFGVPEVIPRRFRTRVRKECRRHQSVLREVLLDVWYEYVDAVLRPARRRVASDVYRKGEAAILNLLEIQLEGIAGFSYSARLWQIVENTMPGALSSFQKSLIPNLSAEIPIGEGLALLVAKVSGQPLEEVRPEVESELSRVQGRIGRAIASFQPLWEALTPGERMRAGRRLEASSKMAATLTSVVHA